MTYKKMTKYLERTKECIEFMYKIQKTLSNDDDLKLCADTINRLLAYKNYLIYEKEYTELSYDSLKGKNESDVTNKSDISNITLTPYTDPKTIDLDYLLREPFGYKINGEQDFQYLNYTKTVTDPKDINTKMTTGGNNRD